MRYPIVLDLETKYTFRDFDDHKKLGISIVCIYDYKDQKYKSFLENELNELFPIIENCSKVIGFNINSFDMQVLQAYYPGKITQFKTFDLLDDIKSILGRRLALNDLVKATLGEKKSGHGLYAIELFKEGKFDELRSYCMDDVRLTKGVMDYGIENREIYYLDYDGKRTIRVNWSRHIVPENGNADNIELTLPF